MLPVKIKSKDELIKQVKQSLEGKRIYFVTEEAIEQFCKTQIKQRSIGVIHTVRYDGKKLFSYTNKQRLEV